MVGVQSLGRVMKRKLTESPMGKAPLHPASRKLDIHMDADLPAWLFEVGSRLFRMLSYTQTCTYPVAVKGKALEGK